MKDLNINISEEQSYEFHNGMSNIERLIFNNNVIIYSYILKYFIIL